jgi:hypothetical protein
MVITAYFDESGTHGGSDVAVMGGFVGDARQWYKFDKRVSKLFARYRVDVFHTIDVKRTDKDFAGWSVDKKIQFIDDFQHIINETVEVGFSSILRTDDYQYYLQLPWPKKVRKDTQYTILFRSCLAAVVNAPAIVSRWPQQQNNTMNIVLESGHRNAPDAVRLYNLFKASCKELSGLTFACKTACLPLAAADLFAYGVFGKENGSKRMGKARCHGKAETSYQGNFYRIEITRDILNSLFQQKVNS